MFITLNINKYPKLINNPFMIFVGWDLRFPVVNNGGSLQYGLVGES